MISIIVAVAENNVIGEDNKLLWHIPEDLKRFKAITTGHPVIMGRKTFESLGRPLPNRTNVVLTHNKDYKAEGCTVVHSLEEAFSLFHPAEELFMIGGGDLYEQSIDIADKLYLTKVHRTYPGDTLFPEIDPDLWKETYREYHDAGTGFPHPFEYINYEKLKE